MLTITHVSYEILSSRSKKYDFTILCINHHKVISWDASNIALALFNNYTCWFMLSKLNLSFFGIVIPSLLMIALIHKPYRSSTSTYDNFSSKMFNLLFSISSTVWCKYYMGILAIIFFIGKFNCRAAIKQEEYCLFESSSTTVLGVMLGSS